MRRKGFTLIELLVVIAIIAILAAILFPVFAKAREKARQSSCLSNIKQCSIGLIMYRDDYDGFWPLNVIASPYAGKYFYWYTLIYPYQNSKNIILCPSSGANATCPGGTDAISRGGWGEGNVLNTYDCTEGTPFVSQSDTLTTGADSTKWGKPVDHSGFYYNSFLSQLWIRGGTDSNGKAIYVSSVDQGSGQGTLWKDAGYPGGVVFGTPDTKVQNPDSKFCVWDTEAPASAVMMNGGSPADGLYHQPGSKGINFCVATRHSGGANFGFCDGHSKWLRQESLGIPTIMPKDMCPLRNDWQIHNHLEIGKVPQMNISFFPFVAAN